MKKMAVWVMALFAAAVLVAGCGDGGGVNSDAGVAADQVQLIEPVRLATYPAFEQFGRGIITFQKGQAYVIDDAAPVPKLNVVVLSDLAYVSQSRDIKVEPGDRIWQTRKVGDYIFIAGNYFVSFYNAATLELVNYATMPYGGWDVTIDQVGTYCIFYRGSEYNLFYFVPDKDLPAFSSEYYNSTSIGRSDLQLKTRFIALDNGVLYAFMFAYQKPNAPDESGKWAHVLMEYDWLERKIIRQRMLDGAGYAGLNGADLIAVKDHKVYYQVNWDEGSSEIYYCDIVTGEIKVVHNYYGTPNSYKVYVRNPVIRGDKLFLPCRIYNWRTSAMESPEVLVKSLTGQPDIAIEFDMIDAYGMVIDGNNLYAMKVNAMAEPDLEVYRIIK